MSAQQTVEAWLYYVIFPVVFVIMSVYIFLRYCTPLLRRQPSTYRMPRARPGAVETTTFPTGDGHPPPIPLDPSVISSLPRYTYKKPISSSSTETVVDCPICLGMVEEGEVVRVLPNCLHIFHLDCIDMWFDSHSTCPICRTGAEPMALMSLVVEGREPDHG